MRLVFAADLHGNIDLYRALFEYSAQVHATTLIVGGDLLPHDSRIASAITTQRTFLEQVLRPLLQEASIRQPGLAVFLLPGNDDWSAAALPGLAALEQDGLAYQLHGLVRPLNQELWIAGYACVPPTPFSIKDFERPDTGSQRGVSFGQAYSSLDDQIQPLSAASFFARPTIAEELETLFQQSNPSQTIYICHTPPANTALDLMRGDRHVGSPALRALIEQYQPLLTLHGHIHEAPLLSKAFACQIGATWSVNPGRDPQKLYAVSLDPTDIKGSLKHTVLARSS